MSPALYHVSYSAHQEQRRHFEPIALVGMAYTPVGMVNLPSLLSGYLLRLQDLLLVPLNNRFRGLCSLARL